MAKVRKDVLYVGKVHPPGLKEPLEFTPAKLAHFTQRMRDMLADNLQIPISWEHQSKARPTTREEWEREKAELTKLTLGHATGAELDTDGVMVTELDVPNDDDRKKLPAIRFVSPEIRWDWKDGRGKLWPGPSITHIAVTPCPVQHDQRPFTAEGVGLSTLRLSLNDYVRLGEDTMAEEIDKKPEGESEAVATEGGDLKKVIECLGRLGLVLPPDTTPENLLDRLHTAALTMEHHTGGSAADEEEKPVDEEPTPVPPPPGGGAGMTLSMLNDRVSKAESRQKRTESRLLTLHRGDLKRRVEALFTSGRIDRPIYQGFLEELDTARLSLGEDGELASGDLLVTVKAYERLPENATGFALSHGAVRAVPPPRGDGAVPNDKPDADVMARLTGGRWKAPA